MMGDLHEQCTAVKFCFLLGKNVVEMVVVLQITYKKGALSKSQVYKWFSHFKQGEMSTDDQPCSRSPLTSQTEENVVRICQAMLEACWSDY